MKTDTDYTQHDDEQNEMARVAPGATTPAAGSTATSGKGMSRHTPGPWECYVGGHEDPGFHVYCTDGRGNGDHVMCVPHDAESEANARLIAASPTMLSALKLIVKNRDISERGEHVELGAPCKVCGERFGVLPNDPDDTCQDCVIDTAIAKAEQPC